MANFEINAECERPMNSERVQIDQSQLGLLNQKLLRKQNFPKMAKLTILGPKRWNLAENRWTSGAKPLTSFANGETQ